MSDTAPRDAVIHYLASLTDNEFAYLASEARPTADLKANAANALRSPVTGHSDDA